LLGSEKGTEVFEEITTPGQEKNRDIVRSKAGDMEFAAKKTEAR
jgi:hypothetical protein